MAKERVVLSTPGQARSCVRWQPGRPDSPLPTRLAFAEDSTIPRNPHFLITSPISPNALFRSIVQGVQRQIATFFASDGSLVVQPEPARFFEVPIQGPLPVELNYIR